MTRMFGTDGVRGVANVEITPGLALRFGRAVGQVLRDDHPGRPRVVVGHDPRWSSPMLEQALSAGFLAAGVDVSLLGVVTTPVVAHATAASHALAGAMISASHNLMVDNGLKFFGRDGFKLSDEEEDRVEAILADERRLVRPIGEEVGQVTRDREPVRAWEAAVTAAGGDLAGLHVVVDPANGSASELAPRIYESLGARVTAINAWPDGRNINRDCGSTHMDGLRRAVVELGADVGIAHDGDADRVLAVDHTGAEVDGDVILAILARDAHGRGDLAGDTVVTTVMTNLGFHHAMAELGIGVTVTRVGDRPVMEAMRAHGHNLGGEQSGHVISLDLASTGDGVLTAVRLLSTIADAGASLHELGRVMTRLPQVLENVTGVDKDRLADAARVEAVIADVTRRLGSDGRVLVRPSGTEPVIRVMVEAVTIEQAQAAADEIADEVRASLSMA